MTAPALNDILSGDVLRVTLSFKLVGKLWAAFFNDTTVSEDVYKIWLDVLQDTCVVSDQKDSVVICSLSTNNTF